LTFENKKGRLNEIITGLYCITSEEHSKGRSNIEVVEKMIKAGVKIIQYREKKEESFGKIQRMQKNKGNDLRFGRYIYRKRQH